MNTFFFFDKVCFYFFNFKENLKLAAPKSDNRFQKKLFSGKFCDEAIENNKRKESRQLKRNETTNLVRCLVFVKFGFKV